MTVDLVIRNGWVVGPQERFHGGVAIDGAKIVLVGPDAALPRARRVIDAEEHFVIPGLIDPHVHMTSEEDPSIAEGLEANLPVQTRGMAHGGVTSFGHFAGGSHEPLGEQLRTTIGCFDRWSLVDGFLHAFVMRRASLAALPEAWALGVTSFKHFFTAYGRRGLEDEGLGSIFSPVDSDVLLESMTWIAAQGSPGLAMAHAEDGDMVELSSRRLAEAGRRDLAAWSAARPAIAEATRVRQAIALSDFTGCPLYVVHVTTATAAEEIARARARGTRVTGETGPHWLTHHAGMEEEIGCWGKVNPPLRTPADGDALWGGLAAGSMSCLGTDDGTGGRTRETKEKGGGKHGNIWAARPGVRGGSEHLLPVMMTYGVHRGRLTMEQLVAAGSANTARAFGLFPRKGLLAPGADADVVIVDPEREADVDARFYRGLCEVSVYEGERLRGMARTTLVRGRVIVDNYETAAEAGTGRYVGRGPAARRPRNEVTA
ncbi:amidohydrolase family protein [Nonomuraea sp. NPDC005650]|uniref:dihydroorotase n=1 Tax=Nonomuraea sp. NPDC005650 TaxID=3157045 RepID=UPI0033B085E0